MTPKRLITGALAWTMSGGLLFAQAPRMSEQAFKNIQVLKGIPVDEFMGTMGLFSRRPERLLLGDCHVGAGT